MLDLTQLKERIMHHEKLDQELEEHVQEIVHDVKAEFLQDSQDDDNKPADPVFIPESSKEKRKKMLELDVNVSPIGIVN